MANKFYLTAQVKLGAPTQSDVNRLTTSLNKSFKDSLNLRVKVTPPSATVLNKAVAAAKKALGGALTVPIDLSDPTKGNVRQIATKLNAALKGKVHVTVHLNPPSSRSISTFIAKLNRTLNQNPPVINVKVNTQSAKNHLNNYTKNVNNAANSTKNLTDSMEEFGRQAARSIRHFGAFMVATTAFIGLIAAVRKGISDAIEFDRQMVRIAQVTGNTLKTLIPLRDEITRVAKSTGVAASSLAQVAVTLSQAGISARDVSSAIETLAKTELAATFGDINNTTEASIAIMRQFNLETSDLEEKLGSVNRVSAAFAVEAEDITASVIRAGGSFKAAGGNFEEFIALLTSVRQTTRASAESIATGFNTIFARLQRVGTQDSLKKLGIDLKFTREEAERMGDVGLEGQFVGAFESVKRLNEALTSIRATDPRFAQIVEELGGFRQIRNVIPLIQQFGVAQKAYNIAIAGGNSLNKDAEIAQQALAVQIAKVREEFTALIRKISENEAFRSMIGLMLQMASAAIKLVDAIEPLLPAILAFSAFGAGKATGRFIKGFKSDVFKFNDGGLIPGTGPNKDTVPAVLTKGEYVINRKAVQKIGVDKLDALNRQGFNKGGLAGYASGGRVTAGGIGEVGSVFGLLAVLQTVSTSFGEVNEATREVIDTFSQIAIQGVALKFAISTLNFDSITKGLLGGINVSSKGLKTFGSGLLLLKNPVTTVTNGFNSLSKVTTGLASNFTAAMDIFKQASSIGDFNTAGNAFANAFQTNPKGKFGGRVKQFGSGLGQLFSDPAVTGKGRLGGLRNIGGALKPNFGGGRGLASLPGKLAGGNPLARGRALKATGSLLKGTAIAGGIGLLGADAITGLREERARKQIAEGNLSGAKDLETASSQGRLASGAIAGGAIGTAILPGIGTAVGAVVGSLAGLATEAKGVNDTLRYLSAGLIDLKTSAEKADSAVTEFQIDKRSGDVAKNSKAFGLANTAQERAKLAGSIRADFGKNVALTASSDEATRQKAIEAVSNNAGDLRAVIEQSIAKGDVRNVDQLSKQFGTNNISTLAQAEGLDLDMLRKEFDAQIKSIQNATKVQLIYTQAQIEAFNQVKQIKNLNTVVGEAITVFDQLNGALSAFDEGKITIPDFGQIFADAAEAQQGQRGADVFSTLLDRVSGLGPNGGKVSEAARAEAVALSSLEDIIKGARERQDNSEFSEENTKTAFDNALRDTLSSQGISDSAIEGLAQRFGDVITTLAKKESSQSNTASAFSPENFSETFDALKGRAINITAAQDLISRANEQQQKLQAIVDRRLAIEQEFIDSANSIVDIRADAEATIATILGQGKDNRSLSQKNAFTDAKLANTLSGTGLGANADAGQIADRNIDARNALARIADRVGQGADPQQFVGAQEELQRIIKNTGNALEFLATNSDKAANAQAELVKLEQQRAERRGVATGFLFGSNEDRVGLARGIGATARAAQSGSVENLTGEQRQGVKSLIDSLRNTESAVFGKDESGKTRTGDEFEKFLLKASGFDEGVSDLSAFERQNLDILQQQYVQQEKAALELQGIREAQMTANANVGGQLPGFATGGLVGGIGNTDSVNAMLMPGEFVMQKSAVKNIGVGNLMAMNNGKQKFANGGLVGASAPVVNIQGLDNSISKFVAGATILAQSMNNFPREINGSFTVKHEIVLIGGEVLTRIMPSVKEYTTKLMDEKLQKFVSDRLPELGRI